ncbi:hypothetical protein ACFLQP_02480 [Acidobacteriota bacterium]
MRLKLPKHFSRWVIFSISAFLVGFIIGWLFIPSEPGPATQSHSLIGGEPAQTLPQLPMEKRDVSAIPIVILVVLFVALLTYGYFREKKKKI